MKWTDLALPWYFPDAPVIDNTFQWVTFSERKQAVIRTSFEPGEVELYFLRLPCDINMSFKLGLRRYGGLNAHVEIKGQRGIIYCDRAKNRNWFNGETTPFNLMDTLEFKPEQENVILAIEKTPDRITIKNLGGVIYNQVFTEADGYCHSEIPTIQVWTNLQRYTGQLELAVVDSNTKE